jgi:hypothetical protein
LMRRRYKYACHRAACITPRFEQPFVAGRPQQGESDCVTRRDKTGRKIMPSSIACLSATLARLATLCIVTAMSGSVWGNDSGAVPINETDLLQWHSVVMVPDASCMKRGWNSTLSKIAAPDTVQVRAATETAGFAHAPGNGCQPSPDSLDAPAARPAPAHDATGNTPRLNRIAR